MIEHALPDASSFASNTEPDAERRQWLLVTGAAGGVAAVAAAVPLVSTLAPSERAKALGAAVEVDIADIPPGGMKTVEWRGKPVWLMRRTTAMLATLESIENQLADPGSLRDAMPDALRNRHRSERPEMLVVIGICTHLGCSPTGVAANSGNPSVGDDWPGGFFCACHGSTFDLAGRVFRNKPAPTNLEIPPHRYVSDTRVRIGESDQA
jgi:ubiquinol-cytochrome c reductase iron-sulfur subunit